MASSNAEGEWVDVWLPTRAVERRQLKNIQPVDITAHHETMKKNAERLLNEHPTSPIFRVDYDHGSGSLSDVYENSYPPSLRQEFRCITCRKFMQRFGNLALVDGNTGALLPLLWNPQDHTEPFTGPIGAVRKLFEGRKVTKEFRVVPSNCHAGVKERGGWNHMYFDFPSTRIRSEALRGLSAASTPELAAMLTLVLKDYDVDVMQRSSQLLLEDKLSHADGHKASIRWLVDLKENQSHKLEAADEVAKHNLLYHMAASSFTGCLKQLRSGAVGTLLSDVKENKSFQDIKGSWNQTAGPLNYMRPSAAPSAGNIAVAERLFSSLGLSQEDMRREYLTLDGIPEAVYLFRDRTYTPAPAQKKGVFGRLVPKDRLKKQPRRDSSDSLSIMEPPPTIMSFSMFAKRVLPTAVKIEYLLLAESCIYFLITGRQGTKPLMQWHDDTNRASWYTHVRQVDVSRYGLEAGWTPVPYIIPFPHLWDESAARAFPLSEDEAAFKYYHGKFGFRYLVGLKGAEEYCNGELCLFPSMMKTEFHGVRSTIERYSKMGRMERSQGEPMVGGIEIKKSGRGTHLFRVTDQKGQQGTYKIVVFE